MLPVLRHLALLAVLAVATGCSAFAPAADGPVADYQSETLPQLALSAPPTRTATPESAAEPTPATLAAAVVGQASAVASNAHSAATAPPAESAGPGGDATAAGGGQSGGDQAGGDSDGESSGEEPAGSEASGSNTSPGPDPVPGGDPPGGGQPASCPSLPADLLAQLRGGGMAVYFRHAMTDWSQSDREVAWVDSWPQPRPDASAFEDCSQQRLLTNEGRAHAAAIGRAVGALNIPIGRVITSRWCRVIETAELLFGGSEVDDRLFDSGYLDRGSSEREALADDLRGLLVGASPGQNLLIVGHMPQLQDVTGLSLEEGEAAVFRSDGGGLDTVVRKMTLADWDCLAHF